MITPEQATAMAAEGSEAIARSVAIFATAFEAPIDAQLAMNGRAVIASKAIPGALLTTPEVLAELENRYRATGWVAQSHDGMLTIEAPAV